MNRRDIMKLFGLGGAAAVLPTVPAPAAVPVPPTKVVSDWRSVFEGKLFATVFMIDGKVHTVPITVGDRDYYGSVRLIFQVDFPTGTMDRIEVWRCGDYGDRHQIGVCTNGSFSTPHLVRTDTVYIDISKTR